MFVPCPHCGFLVALIVSTGGPAQRCPRCRQPLDNDFDESDADPVPVVASGPPPANQGAGRPQSSAAPSALARPPRHARRHRAPSFVRLAAPTGAATGPRWPGRLAVAALAVLLGVQLLLAQRQELAMSDRWRPLVGAACALLSCELPPWREPAAYTMLARSVQPADRPGVLDVKASFRNDARWPQPWPALSLSLSDVRGQAVAQRTFGPGEYRGREAAPTTELAPGQSASVQFEVVEPTPRIVAFTFEFR